MILNNWFHNDHIKWTILYINVHKFDSDKNLMAMNNGNWLFLKIANAKNDISLRDSINGKLFWYTFIYLISQLIYPKSKIHYYTFKVLALISMHAPWTGLPYIFEANVLTSDKNSNIWLCTYNLFTQSSNHRNILFFQWQ